MLANTQVIDAVTDALEHHRPAFILRALGTQAVLLKGGHLAYASDVA